MEFVLGAGLIGTGYLLNNNINNNKIPITNNELNINNDIYSSNYYNIEKQKEDQKLNKNFKKSLQFPQDNILSQKILQNNNNGQNNNNNNQNNT